MPTVLVLCTGNSCRSIMAEALINQLGKGRFKAVSAGSKPTGHVHSRALETLRRNGIDYTNNGEPCSKSWDQFEGKPFDLVITVCDQAASESCPVFLGDYKKFHWSTPDPAQAQSSDETIIATFDETFNLLKHRIETELL